MVDALCRAAEYISKKQALLCTTSLVIMSLLVGADILSRLFFAQSLTGSLETVQVLMVVVVFSSFSNTQLKKGHITADIVVMHLPTYIRSFLALIVQSGCLILGCVWFWQDILATYSSWITNEFTFGFTKYYIWPAKLLMTLGMAAFCLQMLADLVKYISDLLYTELDGEKEVQNAS